jgi:hypothetical protein
VGCLRASLGQPQFGRFQLNLLRSPRGDGIDGGGRLGTDHTGSVGDHNDVADSWVGREMPHLGGLHATVHFEFGTLAFQRQVRLSAAYASGAYTSVNTPASSTCSLQKSANSPILTKPSTLCMPWSGTTIRFTGCALQYFGLGMRHSCPPLTRPKEYTQDSFGVSIGGPWYVNEVFDLRCPPRILSLEWQAEGDEVRGELLAVARQLRASHTCSTSSSRAASE